MDTHRGGRISLGEQRMGALGPETVVEAFPTLSGTGRRRRQVGECGAEIEAGPADDDGRSTVCQGLVDGAVRERLILDHGGLVIELPEATSCAGRSGWAVRMGSPRYTCMESAETSSAGIRSAIASATAVLPEAVGPKTASTLTRAGALESGEVVLGEAGARR